MHPVFQNLGSSRPSQAVLAWHSDVPNLRVDLPSPLGGTASWSPLGYAAWRIVAKRDHIGKALSPKIFDGIQPSGLPETWDEQGGVPAGMSVRGLVLLAACQAPDLLHGPDGEAWSRRLWTAAAQAPNGVQAEQQRVVDLALASAACLWSAPRFTSLQRETLGLSLIHQLKKFVPDRQEGWVAHRLAEHWPQGSRWDRLWKDHTRSSPVFQASRREVLARQSLGAEADLTAIRRVRSRLRA